MNIIVCIDERGGMLFHQRRVSRDQVVILDIVNSIQEKIYMNEYSQKMFYEYGIDKNIEIFTEISKDGCYFIENQYLQPYVHNIEKLVVYCWNRHYPSDFKLDIDLSSSRWMKISDEDLQGKSHEKITKSIYVNKAFLK